MSEENTNLEIEQTEKKKMKKRRGVPVWFVLILLIVAFGGGTFAGRRFLFSRSANSLGMDSARIRNKLFILEECIDYAYLNDVNGEDLENGIYKGLVSALGDPYSQYFTKEEYDDMMETDSGEYKGIGISVSKNSDSGYTEVMDVFKGDPAYKAGIKVGDFIIEVNGKDTHDMELTDVVKEIKTSEAPVVLKIVRGVERLEIKVEKANIELNSVTYEMKDNKIGYISVSQFKTNTTEQFNEAISDLEKQGMKGLIIDLRDNGGGYLNVCIDMVSRIIPEGKLIVYTEDKNKKKDEYHSNSDEVLNLPIVLLVNENTASASEIMTGCLKSYGLATVVGTKTFGKGIVQSILPLTDGSAIKLTVSSYFTPDGVCIHGEGIEPDVKMEMTDEEWAKAITDPKQDKQIKKAIEILTK